MNESQLTKETSRDITPVAKVQQMIDQYVSAGKIHLPVNYSAENALKSAWIMLQDIVDKDKRPVLASCEKSSIINALFDMVVQGLNPMKKQLYFIAYGKTLSCQRSYFGDAAVAIRVSGGGQFYWSVVYKDDVFKYEKVRGRTYVTKHEQEIANVKGDAIIAAYAGFVDANGEDQGIEVMTIEQIHKSWNKSKVPADARFTKDHPAEGCIRTVVRKRAKPIINASDDAMLLAAVQRQELDSADASADEAADEFANKQVIDLPAEPQSLPTGRTDYEPGADDGDEPAQPTPVDSKAGY